MRTRLVRRTTALALLAPALVALTGPAMHLMADGIARRWNADGHMAISAIAWNHMTSAAKARAVQLLRSGPPLAQFSALESDAASADEKDRRLFMAASTWADRVRSANVPSHVYNRAVWHYTDYYWREVNGRIEPVPGLVPDAENALERLAVFEKQLGSEPADTTRAIALAWILHLAGDVHQPLHLSSRVTAEEPAGDKGGNTFRLQGQPSNLHAFWDGALNLAEPNTAMPQVAYADRLAAIAEAAFPFASIPSAQLSATFDVWGRESLDLAQYEVYAAGLHSGDAPSSEYAANAAKVAERRVALAGYRIAVLLNRILR